MKKGTSESEARVIAAIIVGCCGILAAIITGLFSFYSIRSYSSQINQLEDQITLFEVTIKQLSEENSDLEMIIASVDPDLLPKPLPEPLIKGFTSFKPIESKSWAFNKGSLADPFGTRYADSTQYIVCNSYDSSPFVARSYPSKADYYLNNEFTKLKGTIVAHESMRNGDSGIIKILVDSTSEGNWKEVADYKITRKTEPLKIDIDLGTEAKYVRFETSGGILLLMDFVFYND
jgi:hypothetical protein